MLLGTVLFGRSAAFCCGRGKNRGPCRTGPRYLAPQIPQKWVTRNRIATRAFMNNATSRNIFGPAPYSLFPGTSPRQRPVSDRPTYVQITTGT